MKKGLSSLWLLCGAWAILGFNSCSKSDSQDYGSVTNNDRIAIAFGATTTEMRRLEQSNGFIQRVFHYKDGDLAKLATAADEAKFVFLYIDATKAISLSERNRIIEQIKALWNAGLSKKQDYTICALRIGEHAPITEALMGFDVGAGLYIFGTQPDALVFVGEADATLTDVGLPGMADYILQNFSGTKSGNEELPANCRKQIYRHLKFHYKRTVPFDWNAEGTLVSGLPSAADEPNSAVVDVTAIYDIYSATGSTDRWISVNIKGGGYKTNIQTNAGKSGDGGTFVLSSGVHSGTAHSGNLIRRYVVESTVKPLSTEGQINLIERLPENEIKETEISKTKTHEINIEVFGGGGKKGGSGGASFAYNYQWSSTVAYTQADFEMHNTFTSTSESQSVTWKTIPRMWFRKDAFESGNMNKSLDMKLFTDSYVNAGTSPRVYMDRQGSDFPVGFHTMAPQASVLYYTSCDSVTATVKASLFLQDSKQYWCAGIRYDHEHDWEEREVSGENTMKVKFANESSPTIFEE